MGGSDRETARGFSESYGCLKMKVTVAAHGRFHSFEMAKGLHTQGKLENLQTTFPKYFARKIIGKGPDLICAPYFEVLRRIGAKLGANERATDFIIPRFARFVRENIRHSKSDILIGWSSAVLEAIPVAQSAGIKVIIDRGGSHIRFQNRLLKEAYRSEGIVYHGISNRIMERELEEYEKADAILVPSNTAAKTFIKEGISETKLFVTRLGVDPMGFNTKRLGSHGPVTKVISVGAVGIRKGSARLIRAISGITGHAELHLIGPIETGFNSVLRRLSLVNVRLVGPVPRTRISTIYEQADIFCLPSIEEGFGMTVLEAMASGLPVVVSDNVGAADIVEEGRTGFVFPVNDEVALADRLQELICDPEKRKRMGAAAREFAAGEENTWTSYTDRLVLNLNKVLS